MSANAKRITFLTLIMLVVGTDGFVIAGLLKQIADQTGVPVTLAGQLITVFSITYAVLGPVSASFLGRVDRKRVIAGALGVFALGNFMVGLSADFGLMMAGRIVSALGAATLTPAIIMVAGLISPPESRGKAIATVFSGITVATIIGVPVGTFAAAVAGYQPVFVSIAGCALAMLAVTLGFFKALPPPPPVSLAKRLLAFRIPGAPSTLVVTMVVFLSAFTVYSYIGTFFGSAGLTDPRSLTWVLLAFGIGGTIGNLAGGHMTDRYGAKATVLASLGGLALVFSLLSYLGTSLAADLVLALVWGVFGWLMAPSQQQRLMVLGAERSQILISWNSSAMYLGIGLSGISGALSIRWFGVPNLGWVGCLGATVGIVLILACYRSPAPVPGCPEAGND